jgi:hypothetical protein
LIFRLKAKEPIVASSWTRLGSALRMPTLRGIVVLGPSSAPLATRRLGKQEIAMEKSRIVAVLREARGLRKNKAGKTIISARIAAKDKTANPVKGLKAPGPMKDAARQIPPSK